jgi:hypothetical protein
MASLDFVYDLTDKLEDEKIVYLVVALQEGPSGDKVDVFYHINNKESKKSMLAVLERLKHDIAIPDDDDYDNDKDGGYEFGI